MQADHYVTLGIPRGATAEQIRRAYRGLAAKWHPDRNPGPEAQANFRRISEAYDVLSDSAKRSAYDRAAAAPQGPSIVTVQIHPRRKAGRAAMAEDFKRAMRPGATYIVRPSNGRVGPVPIVNPPSPAMPEVELGTKGKKR